MLSAFIWIFTAAESFYSWSRSLKWLFYTWFSSLHWLSSFPPGPVRLAFSRDIFLVLSEHWLFHLSHPDRSFSSQPLNSVTNSSILSFLFPSLSPLFFSDSIYSQGFDSFLRGSFLFPEFYWKDILTPYPFAQNRHKTKPGSDPSRMLQVQTLWLYTFGPN